MIPQINPCPLEKGTAPGFKTQEAGILGGGVGATRRMKQSFDAKLEYPFSLLLY